MDPRKRIVDEKIGRLVKKRDLEFLKRNLLLRETFPLSFFSSSSISHGRDSTLNHGYVCTYIYIYIYIYVGQ